MRREAFRLARDAGAAFVQLHVACPLDVALQRNSQRPQEARMPKEVVRRMDAVFQAPACGREGWDGSSAVCVDAAAEVDPRAVWEQVWSSWGPAPVARADEEELAEERAEARAASAENALHQTDLVCRQLLAEALERLAALPAAEKAAAAKRLNDARRECLAALRRGGGGDGEPQSGLEKFQRQCETAVSAAVSGTNVTDFEVI